MLEEDLIYEATVERTSVAVGRATVRAPSVQLAKRMIEDRITELKFETVSTQYARVPQPQVQAEPEIVPPTLEDAYRQYLLATAVDESSDLGLVLPYDEWVQSQSVLQLCDFAERYGIPTAALDLAVLTTKAHEGERLNQSGIDAQLQYLLAELGYEATWRLLKSQITEEAEWPEEEPEEPHEPDAEDDEDN